MIILMSVLLILVVVIAVAIWMMVIKNQTPKRVVSAAKPDIPYEDIVIPNGSAKLRGWFIPSSIDREQSPLIILVHGWASARSRVLRYTNPLHQAGYALLMFDARSHGESDGVKAPSVKVFHDDIIAVVQYVRERTDIDPERIAILGHSFGGFGSIIANTQALGIKALVTDSMPSRFRTIMEAPFRLKKLPYFPLGPIIWKLMFMRAKFTRKDMRYFNVLRAMDDQQTPVLLVHSKRDNYIPPTELDYLIEHGKLDKSERSYLYVESKGHRSSETDPQFWPNVLGFLQKHIG